MTIKMIILRMRYAIMAGLLSGASLFAGIGGCNADAARRLTIPQGADTTDSDDLAGHRFADWFVVLNPGVYD